MENKLTKDIKISCYEADSKANLKPAAFMDYAQELANVHAEKLGFGYDDLILTNVAWVLSRMHIHFESYPRWRDEVRLQTWHKGAERLFYLRDFRMFDSEGNVTVSATTSWLVLDLETRRLSRNTEIMDENTACKENALEESCPKIQMPKDVTEIKVAERRVAYSDVDINGHANNARYLAWVMDSLDYEYIVNNPVKDIKINFNHEIRPGDLVELYRADKDGNIYIEGRLADKSAFCIELSW